MLFRSWQKPVPHSISNRLEGIKAEKYGPKPITLANSFYAYQIHTIFMVYGTEAVLPCDIIHDSPRVRMYEERKAELDWQDSLDALEEERDVAKARSAFYQQQARRYQSREVQAKTYNIGELILRLPEKKKDKLKPKWEGPFIDKVLTGGAYRLRDA